MSEPQWRLAVREDGGGVAPPRDEAGWDEDSFDKVLLCQRSLPSLRAITPTISHKESGRFYRGNLWTSL